MAEESAEVTTDTGIGMNVSILLSQKPVEERREVDFSLKCIKDKWIPITVIVVITALIITVIALAARKPPPCPPHVTAACPDGWVGYQGKCFYFSETEENWNNSQSHCSSLNASLASIDSLPELDFMLRYKGIPYRWIGLQREQGEGQPWKWTNGFRSEGKGTVPTWTNMGSAAPGATQRDILSASGRTSALEGSQVLQEGTECLRSCKGPMQPLHWMQNLHIHHLLCSI
ncbi:C-type lectin domain family 2 member D-related protein-like isoform X1 [Mauremys reevesii]|uniref:C-type lectin domain family 2 member D-related protein-like isoform X1 n=1 Tax=Mauremys reevesii TaxID=260615 RepID=UPI00193FBC4A|nr:C-type lectin domain family 2 member D-related protein-like isoform X1 [Mauremys reevesii]XP_039374401.1 C-type lectin domain family 2 member D-related protein-like isoform X1 [Mauremys reevesii]XP_039374403.1 C-type lectin domain family 2 member D-related protein-like isoform X1 [Mauremys reevesii]XP_039374404.1 C-type lectin domain family 2 member D-related protein-like isoform X1 [Mauremys reevesii]XP_039374405.1 C-type lectin domain family 2 member D-related protein-like isoform X1 [Maur